MELYRGDFLAGFALRDSPQFDDWQSFQAELLRGELADALDRLARGHSARSEFDSAIRYARRRLALDSLHEPAHRRLMQLYAWASDRAAAVRQYRECVRILEEELGVPPLEETTQLYRAIAANQPPPRLPGSQRTPAMAAKLASQPASSPPMPRIPRFPLVGRAREWETLQRAYEVIGSDGHVVVVEGEAGIGKTRLVDEFLAYTEAQKAGDATAIALPRLSRAAVEELVQSLTAAGVSLPEGLEQRLYEETEGLPFFLVEYLTAISQDPQLADRGEWLLPGGVRDLLRSRLVQVTGASRQLLTAAAVIGRPFRFDILREASGRSDEETVAALEELIAQGLAEGVRGGDAQGALLYDFNHEKLRTLVYEETSLARRRLLHRRVAEALARGARSGRDRGSLASQIGHHYQLAGEEAKAAEYFKVAGEHARALYANAEALAHFQSALALGHPIAWELHEAIGDLQTLAGEYGAALTSYETAAALCGPLQLPTLEHKIGNLFHRRGEWELAERHFGAALEEFRKAARHGECARLYADWSLTAYRQGEAGRALELAERALGMAETAGDALALAQANNILGILARHQGDIEKAHSHLRRSLMLAERLGDVSARIAALNNLALAYGTSGDIEQALTLAEAALALCASQGDRHRGAALHNNLADLFHAAGRSEEAMAHLKQAVMVFSEIGVEAGTTEPEIWELTEW